MVRFNLRTENTVIIFISSLSFLLFLLSLFVCNASAEFKLNLNQKEIHERLQIYTLGDIMVGETALIYGSSQAICLKKNGFGVPKATKIETDPPEDYLTYYKVTRLPGEKVTIEIIPTERESKREAIFSFLKATASPIGWLTCDAVGMMWGHNVAEVLSIDTVEGKSSLKELLEKAGL